MRAACDDRIAGGQIMIPEPTLVGGLLGIAVTARGGTRTIGAEGEWDLAGKPTALRTVATVLDRSPERVVLDLSGLTFMDSSGVHAAIQLAARSRAENFLLSIVPGPRAVQRIFDICNVTKGLPFVTGAPA
jgi:stage II sporulation protein AA (anti-sigma F factor antagonist)